jgi:putative phosphoesterase
MSNGRFRALPSSDKTVPRRVGLISDTHGLLRPEALEFLRGAEHIIHAGDIGNPEILEELGALAPVTAVRGNNDRDRWAVRIPATAMVKIGSVSIYVLHNLAELDLDASKFHVVVSGHSHKPVVKEVDGVLYVNPGSAGPRRFTLPIAVGELRISGEAVRARIHGLRI